MSDENLTYEELVKKLEEKTMPSDNAGYWSNHDYERSSVDRDVEEWVGWEKMKSVFDAIRNKKAREATVATFKVAGRITEGLRLHRDMFTIMFDTNEIKVTNFFILKRWKSIDFVIICLRCGTANGKFEKECKNCGANIIYGGKKRHLTKSVPVKRNPFYIRLDEPFSDELLKTIEKADGLLFQSPYKKEEVPYTRQWLYYNVRPLGHLVALDHLYPHWLRAQRLSHLGSEYGFDELELKLFSGIVKSETIAKYAKKTKSYREKMQRRSNV